MSQASHKLPLNLRTISIDSPEFSSLLTCKSNTISCTNLDSVSEEAVNQSDVAAIIYSSGTTSGRNKGILLTHRNLIGRLAGYFATDVFEQRATRKVSLVNRALFGSFGLITMTRGGRLQLGRLVLLEKASKLEAVLKAVHKYKTYYLAVPWSFVVEKSELTKEYDLSSLRFLLCVGATLGREVSENFKEKFPNVVIQNAYGLTEAGPMTAIIGPNEIKQPGSVGCLAKL
ncbi:hypothetical protein ACOSQ4_002421 [Xanthoceras sorbifolium]